MICYDMISISLTSKSQSLVQDCTLQPPQTTLPLAEPPQLPTAEGETAGWSPTSPGRVLSQLGTNSFNFDLRKALSLPIPGLSVLIYEMGSQAGH